VSSGVQERALRAASVTAVDELVQATGGRFSPQELSSYLAWLCEEGQELHGKVKKHLTRGTAAY